MIDRVLQAVEAFMTAKIRARRGVRSREVLRISEATVKREWRFARAWLRTVMTGEEP